MREELCQALFLVSTSPIQEGREKNFLVSLRGLWLYLFFLNPLFSLFFFFLLLLLLFFFLEEGPPVT